MYLEILLNTLSIQHKIGRKFTAGAKLAVCRTGRLTSDPKLVMQAVKPP